MAAALSFTSLRFARAAALSGLPPGVRGLCEATQKAAEQAARFAMDNAKRSAGELAAAERAVGASASMQMGPQPSSFDTDAPVQQMPRFPIGALVKCRLGEDKWARGHVIGHFYREPSWTPERRVPYQVQLEGEVAPKIFAPVDEDTCIRTALRFDLGARVECHLGDGIWQSGRVIRQYHHEPSWPTGQWVPYQVQLDEDADGRLVTMYAPADTDECIRATAAGGCGSSTACS